MHNLALALSKKGYQVSGSDDVIYEPSRSRLKNYNLLPGEAGWFPGKITNSLDAVILGMHAKANNPELLRAQELGLKIYSYPEFLYEHSQNKTRVVIGGSHGKTTITSMILHVLNYHDRKVDYMVGAQLEGFDDMVSLSNDTDFILLEGDEYFSSAIDLRPKFHLYKPNIALISGIAWDHMNVFPTYENYLEQFRIFIDSLVSGGALVYNQEDDDLGEIVEATANQIRKHPYVTPSYRIENGITVLDTPEGEMPVEIFGAHNLNNLAGAKWICQHMGVDEDDFYEAISSFKGASKRLEKILETPSAIVFRDFAHSPSKVKASTNAVREQYPGKELTACLELHTYSSLNPAFLHQYKDTLCGANDAVVFFSPEALKSKGLDPITKDEIREAFDREDLVVLTAAEDLASFLKEKNYQNAVLLFMSSGNFDNLDFEEVQEWIS